jgi:probable addiction module antidote protein
MATKTIPFDPAEHLRSPEAQAELFKDALESGNARYIANAVGTIARARRMSEVAREGRRHAEKLPVKGRR